LGSSVPHAAATPARHQQGSDRKRGGDGDDRREETAAAVSADADASGCPGLDVAELASQEPERRLLHRHHNTLVVPGVGDDRQLMADPARSSASANALGLVGRHKDVGSAVGEQDRRVARIDVRDRRGGDDGRLVARAPDAFEERVEVDLRFGPELAWVVANAMKPCSASARPSGADCSLLPRIQPPP